MILDSKLASACRYTRHLHVCSWGVEAISRGHLEAQCVSRTAAVCFDIRRISQVTSILGLLCLSAAPVATNYAMKEFRHNVPVANPQASRQMGLGIKINNSITWAEGDSIPEHACSILGLKGKVMLLLASH